MAWPTMRVLRALSSGWDDVSQRSLIAGGDWQNLPMLDALSHPAIRACQDFDANPSLSKYERHKEATAVAGYPVTEARDMRIGPGWRAAIIVKDGVSWIVHVETHDRFHATVASRFASQNLAYTEPTADDMQLRHLKMLEAKIVGMTKSWQEEVIRRSLAAFRDAFVNHRDGQEVVAQLPSPPAEMLQPGAENVDLELAVSVVYESVNVQDGADAGTSALAEVSIRFESWKMLSARLGNSSSADGIVTLLLTTILPVLDNREETWTTEPAAHYGLDGSLTFDIEMSRMRALQLLFAAEHVGATGPSLGQAIRADVHHFVTQDDLKAAIADQEPLRAACGYWFVPARFPDSFPLCDECARQERVIRFLEQVTIGEK
ncbi:DUF3039 domain-containing protein [Arthrobacter koreensis]|uniref:DUF3039 domain-containing protein n=1 Tax=Arthrobacter koreensis TaxID=199136 RepID=UPI000AE73A54|nr:DUF3039 domain-containing protein [Arthrobacter koreensis]